ncbi:Na+/H+ antiporter [Roseomonas sp. BN140053]|uniref:Na+/H+ antiporter n=1 Tax=Roseomonas sp. BN140053 TaxID=3391898 RepID=UPI0039EA562B
MALAEALLALIVACIGFALVARRFRVPYAVVLVMGGMILAFIPGLPRLELEPEFALAFFLPPLLQASAWRTDWPAFRANLRIILLLALGAVLFTAACVAVTAKWLVPELPWAAAVALGAIVAPPDAVAAASVLGRLRIPRRIVTVLEGESLINDASSLVLYRLALGALAAGGLSLGTAGLSLLLVAAGSTAVGWLIGRATVWLMPRLEDEQLETALSLLVSFAIYGVAEALHGSGVLAVVAGAFVMTRHRHTIMDAATRLQSQAVWDFVEFVLTSLVFVLVGLQLNGIVERLHGYGWWELAKLALAVSGTMILARFAWVFATSSLPWLVPPLEEGERRVRWGGMTVVAWAGMRGVVSLAAALALPLDVPARDLMIFLAFCAILATLVIQGTTLEWLIRRLGVARAEKAGMPPHEAQARRLVAKAALGELESRADSPIDGAIARDLIPEYRGISRVFDGVASGASRAEYTARLQLRLAALRAGRDRLLQHLDQDGLPEETLAALSVEMDHEEFRLQRLLAADRAG